MTHLLKIEWLKVKNYKAFWVFVILYAFSILGVNYIGYYINELTVQSMPASQMMLGTPYAFPTVWQTVGFMSSWLLYFPGILFIILFSNEFSFKTHRQNIIDGWTRSEFITVKFVFALLFSLVATILVGLVALLFGFITTSSKFSFSGMEYLIYIFIQTTAYITFAMLLAVIFRRSGVAIAVFFLYGLILEFILSVIINLKLDLAPAGYLLPLQITDVLIPTPFAKDVFYKDAPPVWTLIIGSLFYIFVFYAFAIRKFNKDDL